MKKNRTQTGTMVQFPGLQFIKTIRLFNNVLLQANVGTSVVKYAFMSWGAWDTIRGKTIKKN